LPARALNRFAFGIVALSAFAIMHLVQDGDLESAAVTALTLAVYLFIYTPLKQQSPGTPCGRPSREPCRRYRMGGARTSGGGDAYFRWDSCGAGAIYLFLCSPPGRCAFPGRSLDVSDDIARRLRQWANDDEPVPHPRLPWSIRPHGAADASCLFIHQTGVWFLLPALLVQRPALARVLGFRAKRDRVSARSCFSFTSCTCPPFSSSTAVFWRRADQCRTMQEPRHPSLGFIADDLGPHRPHVLGCGVLQLSREAQAGPNRERSAEGGGENRLPVSSRLEKNIA